MTEETITNELPRLRTDVIISEQLAGEAPVYIVKEPATGRFFRFGKTEGFILRQLDGTISIDALQSKVEKEFEATLSLHMLEQFVEKLRRLGLLQTSERPVNAGYQRSDKRVQGNLFYLRLRAFNPDRFFDRLVTKVQFCFTPWFVTSSAILILMAFGITLSNWTDIRHDLARSWHPQLILPAYLTLLSVVTAHEFAHGLTCKHFGGKVTDLGFLLLYFQPAFYCNVSDAWLFPEKSKRLWVTFAGAYFELCLWALATLFWRVTEPGSALNFTALIVMITSGVKTLFNFNPLIKLDGYYLLSDFLEIPNLRRRAFAYLKEKIRKPLSRIAAGITPRERRVYVIYGLLAAVYSYWLFGWILTRFGIFLMSHYQGWGFVLFLALMIAIFRGPITKLFRMNGKTTTNSTASVRRTKFIKISALIAALVALLLFLKMELKVSGEFTILPVQNAEIRADVGGIIEKVYHDEGEAVEKGTPIVQLSDRDYRAELDKVKSLGDEKAAKLKLLKAGARPEEVTLAKTLVEKAEEQLKYAEKDLDMDRALRDKEIISSKQFAQSEGVVAVRTKELQETRNQLTILLAGNRKEELDATQAEIGSLQAQERYLNEQLDALKVVSPIAGVVTTHRLREKIGQNVNKGDLIGEVHQLNTVEAEIAISEKEIADVRIGQKVLLKARAFPQVDFEGVVSSIAPIVSKREDIREERTLLVITKLENPSLLLKPDMSGNAKIFCGEQRLIDIVARRFVRFIRVEFWSWW